MSAKASVFIATSLDGFIARPDGSIDWLDEANAVVPSGEDCGYNEFMKSVDVLVMGRNTFELALTFDAWPYEDKRVVVLSSKPLMVPVGLPNTVTASSEAPEVLVERLSAEGAQRLYVDGGNYSAFPGRRTYRRHHHYPDPGDSWQWKTVVRPDRI